MDSCRSANKLRGTDQDNSRETGIPSELGNGNYLDGANKHVDQHGDQGTCDTPSHDSQNNEEEWYGQAPLNWDDQVADLDEQTPSYMATFLGDDNAHSMQTLGFNLFCPTTP